MENIILIKGNVEFQITLDPGFWIFDDRRIDLDTYFLGESISVNPLEEYTKSVSKHWDQELKEGAVLPLSQKPEKKYEKEKLLTGTFAIPLEPFINNAEPKEDANTLVIETTNEEYRFPLNDLSQYILGFSYKGRPLKEDGPVHFYLRDGSNKENPIRNIRAFRIE